MDEVHNLINPSIEVRKNPTRLLMLTMLKEMLRSCQNSVLVGFTATPLNSDDGTATELLNIIKGVGNEHLNDEGFISYFMGSPSPAFPVVKPSIDWITTSSVGGKVGTLLPLLRQVELANFDKDMTGSGNLTEYYRYASDEAKASQRCSIGQYYSVAGRPEIFKTLCGAADGKLALCGKKDWLEATPPEGIGYCPDRTEGYCTKLAAVCDDVDSCLKTVVLIHSEHGFKLMLRLLEARFPGQVVGYVGGPPSRTKRWDDEIKVLIGDRHSEAEKAKGTCRCNICLFNSACNLRGEEARIMVADAKYCSEG